MKKKYKTTNVNLHYSIAAEQFFKPVLQINIPHKHNSLSCNSALKDGWSQIYKLKHSPFVIGSWGCHWYPPPFHSLREKGNEENRFFYRCPILNFNILTSNKLLVQVHKSSVEVRIGECVCIYMSVWMFVCLCVSMCWGAEQRRRGLGSKAA